MKKFNFLTMACIALFVTSCQKDDVQSTIANRTNAADAFSSSSAANLKILPANVIRYGALIDAPSTKGSTNFQINVADQLGVSCLRSRTYVPSKGTNPILNSAYKVLLNFNSDYEGTPLPFVSDMTKYQSDLRSIIATFTVKPVVAVIENEESNTLFYSGTPQEYIRQLSTAISVMHANGIKVANGGITNVGLNYLVYQDLLNQGKHDSANQFKTLAKVTPKRAQTQERGAFVDALLQSYTQMDLDYVNFHWKGSTPNTQTFNQVINYLKKRTGKQVISNELGQFDTDPNTLQSHLQLCSDQAFPYVLWYSPDENDNRKGTPLHHQDQSLTTTGYAYQDYLRK